MIEYANITKDLPESVPFVGPETQERNLGFSFLARLGANESVFGPSNDAIKIMARESKNIWKYGDPESYDLRRALADKHHVSMKNIVVGEGIDGLLGYLVRLFISPGDNVVTTNGAYPTFNYHVIGFGGKLSKVEFLDDREDLNSILAAAIKTKAKLVYCSNPNNPMGTINNPNHLADFVKELPSDCLLCLDEAYCDFLDSDLIPNIEVENQKIIRMRTFSKAYGLAGARCGYAIGSEGLIKSFDKIRNHFGMNRTAQLAALASVKDKNHISEVRKKVKSSISSLSEIAIENKCLPVDTYANFIAIDCRKDDIFAKKVVEGLAKRKIFVRMPFSYPQNRCIRVSAGSMDDMNIFRKEFSEVLKELR